MGRLDGAGWQQYLKARRNHDGHGTREREMYRESRWAIPCSIIGVSILSWKKKETGFNFFVADRVYSWRACFNRVPRRLG